MTSKPVKIIKAETERLIIEWVSDERTFISETEVKDYTLAQVLQEVEYADPALVTSVKRVCFETGTVFDLQDDLTEAYFAETPVELYDGEPDTSMIGAYFMDTQAYSDSVEAAYEDAAGGEDQKQHGTHKTVRGRMA